MNSMALSIKSLMLLLVLFAIPMFVYGCGGRRIVYDKDDFHLIGKEIIFETDMAYLIDLKPGAAGKEGKKYNRLLMNKRTASLLGDYLFVDGIRNEQQVKKGMVFTVAKSFVLIPWGLQRAFSHRFRILVLVDEDGHFSTCNESSVEASEWRYSSKNAIKKGEFYD